MNIPIILATDENYAIPTCVVITSVMENADEKNLYDVNILIPNTFSEETMKKFSLLTEKYNNLVINFVDMKDIFSDVQLKISHITTPTFYRLMAASLLPQYEKVLYLDSDIICLSDVAELYKIDVNDYYLAGVKAPGYHLEPNGNKKKCEEIGIPSIKQYINAGVLLMNLEEIRKKSLETVFLNSIAKNYVSQDQDILNSVCYGKIKSLPFKYNVMTRRIKEPYWRLAKVFSEVELEGIKDDKKIIHYADKIKPWKDVRIIYSSEWWKYAFLSPNKEEILLKYGNTILDGINDYQNEINNLMAENSRLRTETNKNSTKCLAKRCYIFFRKNGLKRTIKEINSKIFRKKDKKKDYDYYKNLKPSRYPAELKEWYEKKMGVKLNLKKPRTYNEKIQWMKLYNSTPIKTQLADKYLVRFWVEKKIGEKYLIPLLGVWDRFDDIDFDKLPNKFVLKANHGCGWNVIVQDKAQFDKDNAKEKFDSWMKKNYAYNTGLELHYKNIVPKIIAEEYLENDDGDLYDYKMWCFNGKVEYIMFLAERKQGLKMVFYDTEWNKMPFVYSYPQYENEIEKPANLEEMIEVSEKLSEGFSHVRVDFYRLNDGTLKFGEMTFTSASGACKWNLPEIDRFLGDKIILSKK